MNLGPQKLLLHIKLYFIEVIITILSSYALNDSAEKLNNLKVDEVGVNPLENFSGVAISITLKHQLVWVCLV